MPIAASFIYRLNLWYKTRPVLFLNAQDVTNGMPYCANLHNWVCDKQAHIQTRPYEYTETPLDMFFLLHSSVWWIYDVKPVYMKSLNVLCLLASSDLGYDFHGYGPLFNC